MSLDFEPELMLAFQTLSQLNSAQVEPGSYPFILAGSTTLNDFVSIFECARQHAKEPDQCIMPMDLKYDDVYPYAPIVIEVALCNESYPVLIKEGINWLSSFTDVVYALLLKIETEARTGSITGIRIILMKRVCPKRSDNPHGALQTCMPSDSIVSLHQFQRIPHEEMRRQFRVTIENDQFIDSDFLFRGDRVHISIDTAFLLPNSQDVSPFPQRHVLIDCTEPIRIILDRYPQGRPYWK